MPTINLGRKKPKPVTRNKAAYQDIYQDPRWKRLRAAKLRDNPICEICEQKGIVRQTEEIHHKKPFEISANREELERLAFDYDNLISLCIACHKSEHARISKSIPVKSDLFFVPTFEMKNKIKLS
ncbi:MAG TPA: HNH endonuclease signature motif containing protein [Bacteroidales bacterium]|nr:HNH endonuclease signature motif containing protein [Bacteroidales bacterium]